MKYLETRVLIVGGGPAGSAAGRFLAASGVDCVILERSLNPARPKPCGGGIPCGAFEELRLPEGLIKNRVRSLRVSPPKSEPFEIPFEQGYIGVVERREFDSALRDLARAEGAAVVEGEFSHFLPPENGRLLCAAQKNKNHGEDLFAIRSELVIAADGVNSRVRTALGMKPMSSLHTLGTKLPVGGAIKQDRCEFYFGRFARGGYSWIFPGNTNASAGTGSTDPASLRPAFDRLLADKGLFDFASAPSTPASGHKEGPRGYRIPLWEGQPLVKDKVLFTGDTAGLVMPFTFEGIYYALRSGQLAAQAITQGDPGLYRKLWRQRFRARFLLMKGLWKAFLMSETGTDKLLSAFRDERVQQTGISLWLDKTGGSASLASFIKVLRKHVLF